ncbi:MAG TPA: HAMP domain-containing sensor histidine kinase [Thermoanaerobaculia bacterium]|nr:HAMP domain-containing sensor histidine kinase [Thermoanaerobaculia bacterium]
MRERTRTAFLVALLVATFLLTAFMALRAQMAATYHRATAEKVIRDWTRVAADELARRAEAQAGFYGTYPVLQRMLAMERVPLRAELGDPTVICTFRYSAGQVIAPECPAEVRAWLEPRLAALLAAPPKPADREPLHFGARTFVYALPQDNGSISGFEVELGALVRFFGSVLETRPLIPPSVAEGRITNEVIRVRVRDGARTVFETTRKVDETLSVRLPVEEGLLRGMTVEISIDPYVAPLLVFGGIPRPLPIYMVILALTGILLFTALLQVRKERALGRLRSDFVASVSHELRTPLTQIRMFAETLLLDRVRSDEERLRALRVIDQETRRLAQLVENVLQFSRGERGTLRLVRERIDVAALVAETVELFLPIAAARDVSIVTALGRDAVASVDRDAVRQVVLNLLDNAVKYGPAGQEVQVAAERVAGMVRITVDDAGPGVPAADRKRIWRRYERLERDRERAVAGAGIGLALVRDLVKLHGGEARVEEGARGGSRFVVELPS